MEVVLGQSWIVIPIGVILLFAEVIPHFNVKAFVGVICGVHCLQIFEHVCLSCHQTLGVCEISDTKVLEIRRKTSKSPFN